MLLINSNPSKRLIFEVDINGQPANNNDDNETPTDYTGETDAGMEDTGTPVNDVPTPMPAQQTNTDNTNPTDNPEDYTIPDTDNQGTEPPGGGMDMRPNDSADTGSDTQNQPDAADTENQQTGSEGDGAQPTDYTSGGDTDAEGGDPTGGEEGTTEDDTDAYDSDGDNTDYGMSDTDEPSGDGYEQQIQDLDKDLYADLTEPQMDIRNRELKRNFSSLYDMINDIIERINDISKDTATVKPLEFVSVKLSDLANNVSDYLVYTYITKSYTENEINYNLFLAAVNQINDIIASIIPEK